MTSYAIALQKKIQLTPDTWALQFDLRGQPFAFQMGQFVILKISLQEKRGFAIENGAKTLQHRSFSIASSTEEKNMMEFVVKQMPNGFVSRYLTEIMDIGDEAEMMGPFGHFILPDAPLADSVVFIAAGSGIAPYLSMMRTIVARALPINLHLIFSNKTEADIIARTEIENACAHNPCLSYNFTLTRPDDSWRGNTGRIHIDMAAPYLKNKERTAWFLCGAPQMVNNVNALLEEAGVPPSQITQEIYN